MIEYTYVPPRTWTPLPPTERRLDPADLDGPDGCIGDALEAQGYLWMAESHEADGGIGNVFVWQRELPDPDWPRYALHVTQLDDEAVVWIADLPVLWEFLRRYGLIPLALQPPHPAPEPHAAHEPHAPRCPDCGARMTLVSDHLPPAMPLDMATTLWRTPEPGPRLRVVPHTEPDIDA
jgi:hypothetical protein